MVENKKIIFYAIKILFVILIFYFIGKYIIDNISELNNYKFHINYLWLTISLLLCVIYLINQSFIWYFITVKNKCNIELSKTILSRVTSEFGKYIPGKIFGYTMLFYYYNRAKKSLKTLTFCVFIELIASLLAGVLIIIISLFLINIPEVSKYRFIAGLMVILIFTFLHPRFLEYFSNLVLKILRREIVKIEISYFQILQVISLYIINAFIFGLSFIIFINAIYPLALVNYFFITGSIVIAGMIGLFAVFVPAGLGVREGILVFTLSLIIPPFYAGIIALTSRIWLTFGEVFLFGIIYIGSKTRILKN